MTTAVVPPRSPEMASFIELGDQMYVAVVQDGRAPEEVACELARRLNTRHRQSVTVPSYCKEP